MPSAACFLWRCKDVDGRLVSTKENSISNFVSEEWNYFPFQSIKPGITYNFYLTKCNSDSNNKYFFFFFNGSTSHHQNFQTRLWETLAH